jgi:hypothetical protein
MVVGSVGPAFAAETQITGKNLQAEGHINAAHRRVVLQRSDNGQIVTFRMVNYTSETSIPATTLTALASHLTVTIDYDPAQTSGCGTEPSIIYITVFDS